MSESQRDFSIRRLKELTAEWDLILISSVPEGNPEKEKVRQAILWHEDNLAFGD